MWILLKQETLSGSSISWAVCKAAPRSRQITTPAPHHSVFYRPDALPAAQLAVSKHCFEFNNNNNRLTAFDPGQPLSRSSLVFPLVLNPQQKQHVAWK